jgi:hypothetical protein
MNDLYIEIDPKNKKLLSPPKKLELNWNNISGLCFLEDDKLFDLSWAGYENTGFIKFNEENKNAIRCFEYDNEILNQIKIKLKKKLSEIRYNYECGGIILDNKYTIDTDDRSKLLMHLQYSYCKDNLDNAFIWRSSGGNISLTSEEFIVIFHKVVEFIQRCDELEAEYVEKINSCTDVINLCYINLDKIDWNFNSIAL